MRVSFNNTLNKLPKHSAAFYVFAQSPYVLWLTHPKKKAMRCWLWYLKLWFFLRVPPSHLMFCGSLIQKKRLWDADFDIWSSDFYPVICTLSYLLNTLFSLFHYPG